MQLFHTVLPVLKFKWVNRTFLSRLHIFVHDAMSNQQNEYDLFVFVPLLGYTIVYVSYKREYIYSYILCVVNLWLCDIEFNFPLNLSLHMTFRSDCIFLNIIFRFPKCANWACKLGIVPSGDASLFYHKTTF